MKNKIAVTAAAFSLALVSSAWAGTEMKWADVPEAVRATVLANGGTARQSVDRENEKKDGLAILKIK